MKIRIFQKDTGSSLAFADASSFFDATVKAGELIEENYIKNWNIPLDSIDWEIL